MKEHKGGDKSPNSLQKQGVNRENQIDLPGFSVFELELFDQLAVYYNQMCQDHEYRIMDVNYGDPPTVRALVCEPFAYADDDYSSD